MAGPGRRRTRREEPEEHENHERWLVTYADMVTLLMVLFIVMFAMSSVDQKKFNALKVGLAAGFGDSTAILDGSDSLLENAGVSDVDLIEANQYVRDLPKAERAKFDQALLREDQLEQERRYAEAAAELSRLEELLARLDSALRRNGLREDIQAGIDERGLVLSLVSKHVVFEPDLAQLSSRGLAVLDVIAPVLRTTPDPLRLDGHTNQVPVKPKYYPTDWELSAARAVTVLRHFNEQGGIPNERMTASAFGHEQPLIDPSKPGSQQINRRVDVVVLSSLPPETRALLDDVAEDRFNDTEASP